MASHFEIVTGFPENRRQEAAHLFWQAFAGKLGKVLRPEDKALRFVGQILDPAFAISAVGRDGTLLVMAGFKTGDGALVGGDLGHLTAVYGAIGGLWRGVLLSLLEREPEADCLLMDGIFVAASARGKGVGSALLDAVGKEAARRGLARVRLDVIDTNPRARALYERAGFKCVSEQKTGPFKWLFGFSSAARMEKPSVCRSQ